MEHRQRGTLSRRRFVNSSALAAGGLALASAATRWAPAQARRYPPNLLFIHTDQQYVGTLSAHGCQYAHTPNMDRLAQRGTSFRLSYSANPVCCPARACWYTGRASSETGVVKNSWPIDENLPDLGQWFSARGYEAVYAGKWHVPARNYGQSFRLINPGTGIGEHSDGSVSRAAAGFFRSYRGDKPFFLSLGFLQPHDICYWVFEHTQRLLKLPYPQIADELPPLPDNFEYDRREPESFQKQWRQEGKTFRNAWTELQWRYYQWAYYRSVEMADAEIGRVLEALEDTGLAEDTLVIFSADHGDGHGRHQMISKMYFYDEAAAVPFVVSWPGQVAEGVQDTEHVASGLDVAPTLCDYAGIEAPPKQRGRSLRPLLEHRTADWREFVVSEVATTGRMVRTPEYKLISYKGDETDQLFDMRADPGETKNLFGDAKFADVHADLKSRLQDWESRLEPLSLEGREPLPRPQRQRQQPK